MIFKLFGKFKIHTQSHPNPENSTDHILIILVAGSCVLLSTGKYLGFNLAGLSYIKQNLETLDLSKSEINDYFHKVIYYRSKPTVLLPALDNEYDLYPKNCVWLKRKVQRKKKNWETVNYYKKITHLFTKTFYSDSVQLTNLFINSNNFKEFYKKGEEIKLDDVVSNSDSWLKKLEENLKNELSIKSDYIYFKEFSNLRVGFEFICIDPNQNISAIGQLDENKFLGKIQINKKPNLMLISKGNYTAQELIEMHKLKLRWDLLVGASMGLTLNLIGFYLLNDELYKRLILMTFPNRKRFRIISNSIGMLYSILLIKMSESFEKLRFRQNYSLKRDPVVIKDFIMELPSCAKDDNQEFFNKK